MIYISWMELKGIEPNVIPAPVLRSSYATEGGKAGIQSFEVLLDPGWSLSHTLYWAGVTSWGIQLPSYL